MKNADLMIISISYLTFLSKYRNKLLVFRGNQRNNDPDQVDPTSV